MPTLRFLAVDARRRRPALRPSFGALAELIAAAEPDLACVHGSPAGPRWRTVSGALAREAGLVVVAGGRAAGSNLLLSNLAVEVITTRDVSLEGAARRRVGRQRGHGAVLAVLQRGPTSSAIAVAAARLAADPTTGSAQAAALQRALTDLSRDDLPTLLSAPGIHLPDALGSSGQTAARGQTVLPGGVFVDDRIAVGPVRQLNAPPGVAAAVLAELTLPD